MDQEWICTAKWYQATPSDGVWLWTLYRIDGIESKHRLVKLEEGSAFSKLGVYWKVWRVCRKCGFKFRPWSKTWTSGSMPEKNDVEN